MTIRIDTLRVAGLRGLANLELSFPRVTLLIGQNNTGKTSVLKALQLALGDYSRYLSDEDFFIDNDEKRVESITIDLRFVPRNHNDGVAAEFSEDWQEEFGDKIQQTADGMQFVVIRTIARPDRVKGGFLVERYHLEKWPEFATWLQEKVMAKNRISKRLEAIPFVGIDAQRDIHAELKEKASYIGRVLSRVEYSSDEITKLEEMIAKVNEEAIAKSTSLKTLKQHLDKLAQSLNSLGNAELSPFPKKIRDLSKRFNVNFGESSGASFPMEYHGMGTRSWASMLSVKALIELQAKTHEDEATPFFPILAAEEPEAHLHPNAQRTLYQQLREVPGQILISTHSPYLAGIANIEELRFLSKITNNVSAKKIRTEFEDHDDLRKIQREVVHSRGELLFSKAIVLSEGETEEQALPALFEAYMGVSPFIVGINFVGVGGSGSKYRPFLTLAKDLEIPVFIFSDGEPATVKALESNYKKVFGETENLGNYLTVLDGTDFEGYLLDNGYQPQIEAAITEELGPDSIEHWIKKKNGTPLRPTRSDKPPCPTCRQSIFEAELRDYSGDDGRKRALLDIIQSQKPTFAKSVSSQLAKLEKQWLPPKVIEFFEKIKVALK